MQPLSQITPLTIDFWAWVALVAFWLVGALFVRQTKFHESRIQRMLHVVPLYLGFNLIFSKRYSGPLDYRLYGNGILAWVGMLLTVTGVGFAMWARVTIGRYWSGIVTLKHNHRLIQNGPYKITRHPIYTGFIVGVFGTMLSAARVDALIGFAIITIALVFKLRREETLLNREFGDEYTQFKQHVPAAILPGVY